jgi:hypothetical protein
MSKPNPILSDFRNFLYVVWKHLNLPDPTPVQYDIAQYLQHGPTRSMISAFRGVGKSWVTSAYVCWLLLNDPQLNILVVSASKDRADAFSTFTKRLISELPILAHLQPGPGQRDSNIAFDVDPARASHAPSVKSVGITGQITGSRANVIIADDIETPNNSLTVTARDQLAERVKEFDAVLKPEGTRRIIYLGTPQTEQSLYNQLPSRGYEVRVWPARVPMNVETYKGKLAPYVVKMIDDGVKAGTPVDPQRFNEMDLLEREASYARSGFALQFMLDTSLSDMDRYPLRLSDLMFMSLDPRMAPAKLVWCNDPDKLIQDLPNMGLAGDRMYRPMWYSTEMAEYTGSVMSIDPSGRGKDQTGYAIVKILHGNLYVMEVGGFQDGFSETTLKSLAVIAKKHNINHCIIEENYGGGMFAQLFTPVLARLHPTTVEEVKHSIQKEKRMADVLEPVMNQHRLVFDINVIKADYRDDQDPRYSLVYQMTRLTRDKGALRNDDKLDALSMAVQYWVEHMSRDTEKAATEHKEALLDKELEKFMGQVLGAKPVSNTWFNI